MGIGERARGCGGRAPWSDERWTGPDHGPGAPTWGWNTPTGGRVTPIASPSGRLLGRVRLRFTPPATPGPRGPGGHTREATTVKNGIHPEYVTTAVTCGCGNSFSTRSTKTSGSIFVEVCSACHPFYTGKQKILDTGGRVARFEARYGKRTKTAK
ncbi:hypothetical protein Aglo01_03730 [Actinokineospora globicatena]|nr:hypothetical protein Aglo01_03730 [Actinokineospora globicatena]GLW82729.1 hypothetical protein Aglo02_03700 [Actinokineospora globicatena]